MVESASYIKRMLLQQEMVLSQGFGRNLSRGTRDYGLVLVGHSLGAGVVAILSLMLQDEYPLLKCYAYSPPGGLLRLVIICISISMIYYCEKKKKIYYCVRKVVGKLSMFFGQFKFNAL